MVVQRKNQVQNKPLVIAKTKTDDLFFVLKIMEKE